MRDAAREFVEKTPSRQFAPKKPVKS